MEVNNLQSYVQAILQKPDIYIELIAEITIANVVISDLLYGSVSNT